MNFFKLDPKKSLTANWLKGAWRKIVLTVHPDKGGKHEDYIEAQNEYEQLLQRVGSPFTAVSDSPEAYSSFDIFLASISPRVRDKFVQSYPIAGEGVEVCGWWIWIKVEQYSEIGKKLYRIGYKWAPKKQEYYWAGIPKMSRRTYTKSEIQNCFGSKKLEQDKIEA